MMDAAGERKDKEDIMRTIAIIVFASREDAEERLAEMKEGVK